MTKRHLKRLMPTPEKLQSHPGMARFGTWLQAPYLWHLRRRGASRAVGIGLFCAFMPFPGHMLLATAMAIALQANLPLAILSCWANNPLTIGPVYYVSWRLGAWVLGADPAMPAFEPSLGWMLQEFNVVAPPLITGTLLAGLFAGLLGLVSVQLSWRWHTTHKWIKRKQRRQFAAKKQEDPDGQ